MISKSEKILCVVLICSYLGHFDQDTNKIWKWDFKKTEIVIYYATDCNNIFYPMKTEHSVGWDTFWLNREVYLGRYFETYYNKITYPIDSVESRGLRNAQLGAIHAIASFFTINKKDAAIVIMPTGSAYWHLFIRFLSAVCLCFIKTGIL